MVLPPYDREAAALGVSVMADFLRSVRAYDVLPDSGKLVVFDVSVPVKLAFYALVEHGAYVRAPRKGIVSRAGVACTGHG